MKLELSAELGICDQYEKLLNACEQALTAWSVRSEELRRIHLTGVEVGGELLRLQANFAKAYALLRRHTERCERCRSLVGRSRLSAFDAFNAA